VHPACSDHGPVSCKRLAQFNSDTENLCQMISKSLGHKGPCTYLIQKSANECSSTCLYSIVDYFLFFLIPTQHVLNVLLQIANKKGNKKLISSKNADR
jgi:hypothetical protein